MQTVWRSQLSRVLRLCAQLCTSTDAPATPAVTLLPASDPNPSYTVKSIESALRQSAALGALQPGVLEYFGIGDVRKRRLGQFDSVGCSLLVHSLGTLSTKITGNQSRAIHSLLQDLVLEVTQSERLEAFDTRSLAQILHGFSLTKAVDAVYINTITAAVIQDEKLEKLDGKTITSLLTSLARLRYKQRDPVLKLAVKAVSLKKWMLDQELSNVFWSFGILGISDGSLLDALTQEMMHPRILSAFTPQALSSVLLTCARLSYSSNVSFLHAVVEEITRPYRLKSFEEQHLGSILWAAGKLRCAQPSQMTALAQECIASNRLKKYTPTQLCNIFAGWAHAGDCFHDEAYHILLHTILDPTGGMPQQFSPFLMAKLVWSMGKLKRTTQEDFEIAIGAARAAELVIKYNNQDLSNIFIGCGKQRYKDRDMMRPLFREAVASERLMSYSDLQLANLTWALGEMGVQDKRIFRLLARGIVESESLVQQPSLVIMVLKGWAHVDFSYTPGLQKVTESILKPSMLAKFTPKDIRAILCFMEGHVIQILEDQLPENNKGVMARYRQRSMALDDKDSPELFTVRNNPS